MTDTALSINKARPLVMHIDLNSCFAIIEQQANRLLRGRPLGIAAYDTPRGFVLAASYQAKHQGVKLGVNVQEARQLCPGIVILTPDPAKYREAHRRFKEVLLHYTNDVHAKSIDEFVINFQGSPALRTGLDMEAVAADIKRRISEEMGEAVTVNIGIAPNRFLAKYAAGFDKPDGLTRIDHTNLIERYQDMDLVDLPGINVRYRARLQAWNINTPLEFLQASRDTLQKQVFKGIVGYYWYLRLRGYEADNYESKRRSIGHQYALPRKTRNKSELARLLLKLCEKVGRRLRKNDLYAGGIHLYLSFVRDVDAYGPRENGFIGGDTIASQRAWHHGEKTALRLYSTHDIYQAACRLLDKADVPTEVRGMSITVFDLQPWDPEQLALFSEERAISGRKRVSDALDAINNRYGEFVVTPASMMAMRGEILDRIAFGQVRDL